MRIDRARGGDNLRKLRRNPRDFLRISFVFRCSKSYRLLILKYTWRRHDERTRPGEEKACAYFRHGLCTSLGRPLVSLEFGGCQVPGGPGHRTGESGVAAAEGSSQKEPAIGDGSQSGRSGKVSRFAAGLCVAIHTRRKTLLAHEPFRNRAARHRSEAALFAGYAVNAGRGHRQSPRRFRCAFRPWRFLRSARSQ